MHLLFLALVGSPLFATELWTVDRVVPCNSAYLREYNLTVEAEAEILWRECMYPNLKTHGPRVCEGAEFAWLRPGHKTMKFVESKVGETTKKVDAGDVTLETYIQVVCAIE
ncbi:MAG: hypothetical protein AB7G93_22435 [Bdellovibrionales bacterium]